MDTNVWNAEQFWNKRDFAWAMTTKQINKAIRTSRKSLKRVGVSFGPTGDRASYRVPFKGWSTPLLLRQS